MSAVDPPMQPKKANAVHCQFIDVPRRRLLQRKKNCGNRGQENYGRIGHSTTC